MSIKRQTLWSMAPLLAVTVVNVFSVPLFYRYLGSEKYALWFYVLTFSGSFGFMDLGLGVAVGRYIGIALGTGDLAAVRSYWATGNLVAIPLLGLMALIFVGLGVFFGPHWFNVAPDNISLLQFSFVAGGVGLFLTYYGQFWNILSQAHLDFKFLSILRMLASILQILPAILLARLTGSPLILIAWSTAVSALVLFIYVWHSQTNYSLGFNIKDAEWERAREMAAFTGKTFLSLLINSLLGSVDRVLLGKLAPPTHFANYNVAANVGGRLNGISVSVMGPIFHNTSRSVGGGNRRTAAGIYDEMFQFILPWYFLTGLWAILWGGPALRFWLGPELGAQVQPIFAPIICGFCLTSLSNISGSQLGPLNRVGAGLIFNVAAGVVLAAGVWLGWQFGELKGVAFGFLASRFVMTAQDLFVMRLVGAKGWLSFATLRSLATHSFLGGAIYLCAHWLTGSRTQLFFAFIHMALASLWNLWSHLRVHHMQE